MRTVNNIEVGIRIRALRERHNLTREQLSEILDITPKFLGDIESGSRGMSNNTLVKIANFFSVTTDFILFSDAAIYDDFIFIDLIHHCPASKRKYLKNIIEQFIESANS
ncbi:MAG: helix-turn-helix domain-containing protein [Faecalibacillus intestinalis]|jgi:transcriptional regulator with XRE-family HTH domain|uniref:helix-turn-helix domain-containing protein n=1 Tax=Coprobacillus cateniformis TaxID=100884 RepID=UPI0039A0EB92